MSANHSLSYLPSDAVYGSQSISDAQPWLSGSEPLLPAQQVMWVSLALIGIVLVVLFTV